MKLIDNSNLSCPQPVINTKKAIEEGLPVKTIVDNEIAKENILKLCGKLGVNVDVQKIKDKFEILITGENSKKDKSEPVKRLEGVYLIKSKILGNGDNKLGEGLMKAFIYTLFQREKHPKKIMLLNSGVFLAVKESQLLDQLKAMEESGTEILSCGACLDFFGLKDSLAVGSITNMYDIVENLNQEHVITL